MRVVGSIAQRLPLLEGILNCIIAVDGMDTSRAVRLGVCGVFLPFLFTILSHRTCGCTSSSNSSRGKGKPLFWPGIHGTGSIFHSSRSVYTSSTTPNHVFSTLSIGSNHPNTKSWADRPCMSQIGVGEFRRCRGSSTIAQITEEPRGPSNALPLKEPCCPTDYPPSRHLPRCRLCRLSG